MQIEFQKNLFYFLYAGMGHESGNIFIEKNDLVCFTYI